jgi:putative transport protein
MAGGPLFVALILGHFGRVGRIVGHIPRNTRMLLQELGLVFFLADAGVKGGGQLIATVQNYGAPLFVAGIAVTIIPIAFALPIALKWQKMNILQALGGICGGMTSTPALGAITARTDSQIPVVSYASAYPVALIMMTVFAKLLIQIAGCSG